MKTLLLMSLHLVNFKGLRDFTLDLRGRSAEVRGDNGTGKTTLADAWSWLLWGRDSAGRTDFSIKTLVDGVAVPSLDHAVEAVLEVDGQMVTLAKNFREKWTKKRGAAQAEMTGHTTEYSIDGVPLQEKEWRVRIDRLIPEETCRLVSSPTAFLALHWERRRALLLSLCGGIGDAEAMASTPELAPLLELLGGRSPEDHRKVALARRQKVNARLGEIPARIDEATRTLPQGLDRLGLGKRLAELELLIAEARDASGDKLRRERSALETQRQELSGQREQQRSATLRALRDRLGDAQAAATTAARSARLEEQAAKIEEERAARLDAEVARLRTAFRGLAAAPAIDGVCRACGQALPASQVAEAERRARADRAEQLRDNTDQGLASVAAAAGFRSQAAAHLAQAATHRQAEATAQATVEQLTGELAAAPSTPHPLTDRIVALAHQVEDLDEQIAAHKATDPRPLEDERKTVQAGLAKLDAAAATGARIEQLAAEQKTLGAELERLERELYLLDRLVVVRAELTEAAVNGLFELARFRLFRPQINGGLEQCCDVLVDGVPAGAGLNRGSEINVGLDLVRTLSRHYGLRAPVWLDNAEAVVAPLNPEAQLIRLVVDGSARTLEVSDVQ